MSKTHSLLGHDITDLLHTVGSSVAKAVTKIRPPSILFTKQQEEAYLCEQIEVALDAIIHDRAEAVKIFSLTIDLLSRTHHDIDSKKIHQELVEIGGSINNKSYHALILQTTIQGLPDPQTIFNISPETMKALYTGASYLLSESNVSDAMKCFALLCQLEPNEYNHWIGLGHASYHSDHFGTAVTAYYRATALRSQSPWPMVWAANACEGQGEIESAIELLQRAKDVANELVNPDKGISDLIQELQARISTAKYIYQ